MVATYNKCCSNNNGRRRSASLSSAVRSILFASIAAALVYDIHLHVIYRRRDGVFDSGMAYIFERATQDVLIIRRSASSAVMNNNNNNDDNSDNVEESESPVGGSGSNSSASNSNNNHDTTSSSSSSSSSNSIAFHFPTVEERVRYYMGSWYDRKYNESSGDSNRNSAVLDEEALCNDVPYYDPNLGLRWWDLVHIFEKKTVVENIPPDSERYFPDVWNHVFRHADEMGGGMENFKAMALFGDTMSSLRIPLNYPIMFKARLAESPKYTRGVDNPPKYTPILAMLETARHYAEPIAAVDNLPRELVVPWERKMNTLLWRGATSGPKKARIRFIGRYYNYNETGSDNSTDKLVDVGFTTRVNGVAITRQLHQLMKPKLNYAEQLNYKYLLSLEGNDVATGLKWMLYSNSVVFMPHPVTRVSWAMEDRLVPFYHFVPLKPDLSNLLEMIIWARANDEECKRISERATEYVKQLYATAEAKKNNDIINRKIVQRYHALYGPALSKCDRNRNSYAMACDNVTAGNGPYQGPFVQLDPCRDYTTPKKKT